MSTEADTAKAKRRRRLTWALVALWISDWIFSWTAALGFEELGAWLWLIGLLVFVYRSVVGTKLPEWALSWAWLVGVLGLWMLEVVYIHEQIRDPEFWLEMPEFVELIEQGDLWMAMVAALMSSALAMAMLGWAMGVIEVLIGSLGLGLAFRARRRASVGRAAGPPTLVESERQAYLTLVVLQSPVFALLIAFAIMAMSGGLVMWRGAADLPAPGAHEGFVHFGRLFTLGGLAAFFLGVLQFRQLLALRWGSRLRLILAAIVPCVVLGGVVLLAVTGSPALWILVLVALLWALTQVRAVRQLWPLRGRLAQLRDTSSP